MKTTRSARALRSARHSSLGALHHLDMKAPIGAMMAALADR